MKNRILIRLSTTLFCGILVAGMFFSACTKQAGDTESQSGDNIPIEYGDDNSASMTGIYFDTVISIKIYGDKKEELLKGAFNICKEMENVMSADSSESELYQVNHRSENTVHISEELAECIKAGLYYSKISDGAFDITILPVRQLWNFKEDDHKGTVPDAAEIKEKLQAVGYEKVHLDGQELSFDDDNTMIDLGGIAKGYISSKLKEYLKNAGCTSAMINLGGNVSSLGTKPNGNNWVVGIQKPFDMSGEILTTVESKDNAVISSGIYERYFEADGKIYHHILDPRTGYPVDTNYNEVTVVGSDDTACDALATIGISLGEEGMRNLVEENGLDVEVMFTDRENEFHWM